MSVNRPRTDYFNINTTRIYSANPSGNFTVISLPLTGRHLQDLESPSYYNLLFDLIANRFSNTTLHRRSPQQITSAFEPAEQLVEQRRPALTATKSAEAVLTPQRREHQQGCGCTKFASRPTRPTVPLHSSPGRLYSPLGGRNKDQPATAIPAATYVDAQSRDNPYYNPSRIAARSFGALLAIPEHPSCHQDTKLPHRSSPVRVRSAEEVLPKHKAIIGCFTSLCFTDTNSSDQEAQPQPAALRPVVHKTINLPQPIPTYSQNSTASAPQQAMVSEDNHNPDHSSPDPFTAFGNPHRDTTLPPHKAAIQAIRNAKKAARTHAAEKAREKRQKERADKAAQKIEKENAEAAKRAEKEHREGAEKMRKLEIEAEKKRLRREEQVVNMEKRRHYEEEKERVMEVTRQKRALGGMAWGFDPGAGMRASRSSESEHGLPGSAEDSEDHGMVWGISSGGPGRIGGHHGSDVSKG